MSVYAIGDVHGCLDSLKQLLQKLPDDAEYLFIGDIVNRGPRSLETIRFIMSLGDRARCLFGNHELHLLAVYAGARKIGAGDTIQEILDAPDCDEIIEWLRDRQMALFINGYLAVHAACHWSWTVEQTLEYGQKVERLLKKDNWKEKIGSLFGREQWRDTLKGKDKLRAIVNVITRTRYLTKDGDMDFKQKNSPSKTPKEYIPWYEYPNRKTTSDKVVFGHWSTLGLIDYPNTYCLDTGCLWGGSLTAMSLDENHEYISVDSPLYVSPF